MSILRDLTVMFASVKDMLLAARDLSREMRQPETPQRHLLDASPLPTMAEVTQTAGTEGAEWDKLDLEVKRIIAEQSPPASGISPTSTETAAAP